MAKSNMDQDILKVLFSEQEIHDRIQEMGNQLYDEFHDRNPLFVGVLNGCFLFMADLVRATQCKSEVEFIGLSSYQNATKSSGVVQITRDLQRDISGRDIIVVEDILDSGNTLYFLKDYMLAKGANSITIVTLLDKPSRREKPIYPDLAGFEVPDEFVVEENLWRNVSGVIRAGGWPVRPPGRSRNAGAAVPGRRRIRPAGGGTRGR